MARLDWKPSQSEVMKARWAEKKAAQQAKEEPQVSKPEPRANQPEVQQPDLSNVLERLERLEKENAELKDARENPFKNWKERYNWPLRFKYKLWGWVPVLNYVSLLKDPTKDLTYMNQFWKLENNQNLKISLANGKTLEVDSIEFGKHHSRGEEMEANNQNWEVITTDNVKFAKEFKFQTKDFGEITVLSSVIN